MFIQESHDPLAFHILNRFKSPNCDCYLYLSMNKFWGGCCHFCGQSFMGDFLLLQTSVRSPWDSCKCAFLYIIVCFLFVLVGRLVRAFIIQSVHPYACPSVQPSFLPSACPSVCTSVRPSFIRLFFRSFAPSRV